MEEPQLREVILRKASPPPPRKKWLTRFLWGAMGTITLFFAFVGLGELASMGVFGDSWQAGSTGAFLKGLAFIAELFRLATNLKGVIGVAVLSISCLWFALEFLHNSISQEVFVDSLPWRQREVLMRPEESVVARTFSTLSLNQEDPRDLVRLGVNPMAWFVFSLELLRLTLLSGIDRVSSVPQNKGVVFLKGFLSALFVPLRPLKGIVALIDLLPRFVYGAWRFLHSLISPPSLIEGGGLGKGEVLAIAYDPLSQEASTSRNSAAHSAPAAKGGYRLIHAFRILGEEGAEEKQGEKEETPPATLTEERLRSIYGFSYERLESSEGGRSYCDAQGNKLCLSKVMIGKYQAIYGGKHLSDLEVENLAIQIAEEREGQQKYRQELVRDANIFRQKQAATESAVAAERSTREEELATLRQQLSEQKEGSDRKIAKSDQAIEAERIAREQQEAESHRRIAALEVARATDEQMNKAAIKAMEERFLEMLGQQRTQNAAPHENIPLSTVVVADVPSLPVQPAEEKEPAPGTLSTRAVLGAGSAVTFLPPPPSPRTASGQSASRQELEVAHEAAIKTEAADASVLHSQALQK